MVGLERRRTTWLAGSVLLASLGGCGGGGTTPTPVISATPTPCTQSIVGSATGSLPAESVGGIGFTTPVAGRADVTVDWTLATSSIGVYVVPASPQCDIYSFNARTCGFLAVSEPSAVKPRKVSATVTTGGIYQLMVANYSGDDESVSGQIVLSIGPCPTFGATSPTTNRRGSGPALSMREVGRLR